MSNWSYAYDRNFDAYVWSRHDKINTYKASIMIERCFTCWIQITSITGSLVEGLIMRRDVPDLDITSDKQIEQLKTELDHRTSLFYP